MTSGSTILTCNAFSVTLAFERLRQMPIAITTTEIAAYSTDFELAELKSGPELGRATLERLKSLSEESSSLWPPVIYYFSALAGT